MAVPMEDVDKVKEKAKEILGEITVAPMAGTEIAIVSNSCKTSPTSCSMWY